MAKKIAPNSKICVTMCVMNLSSVRHHTYKLPEIILTFYMLLDLGWPVYALINQFSWLTRYDLLKEVSTNSQLRWNNFMWFTQHRNYLIKALSNQLSFVLYLISINRRYGKLVIHISTGHLLLFHNSVLFSK